VQRKKTFKGSVEYTGKKKRQLTIFDAIKPRPAKTPPPAAPAAPAEPPLIENGRCFDCNCVLKRDEAQIGICRECFTPRR
jgi:hypothetical protein